MAKISPVTTSAPIVVKRSPLSPLAPGASANEPARKDALPWERQDGESSESYRRFVQYRNTPASDRTLANLGVSRQLAARWSKRYAWLARTEAYDAWLTELEDELGLRGQVEHRAAAARFSKRALAQATRAVDELDTTKVEPEAAIALARAGVELGRQATGLTSSAPVAATAVGVNVQWGGESPAWLDKAAGVGSGSVSVVAQTSASGAAPVTAPSSILPPGASRRRANAPANQTELAAPDNNNKTK